ncbi:hypothetical protein [uncultured Oxalicibacterium sp.]|uniref:hypothetical protein n=1 Tax=uncultured Oxalicibacterium sp. TaxID=1168540 RepID=UPI0025CD84CD|nr:hypothetical protein [uncultured Oxalicibacterium sp.]
MSGKEWIGVAGTCRAIPELKLADIITLASIRFLSCLAKAAGLPDFVVSNAMMWPFQGLPMRHCPQVSLAAADLWCGG